MVSADLTKKLERYSQALKNTRPKNRLPATIIGAEHGRNRIVDRSGSVPTPMAKSLIDKLEGIGTIGAIGIDNYLGCCSEVRASNKILLRSIAIPIRNIQFTDAIRPRTGQRIIRCKNCINVFGYGV